MGVRVDQALHWLCLMRSRALAARACREGRVRVNGSAVRPAREVRAGDRILLRDVLEEEARELELLAEPPRQISRREASAYYRWSGAGAPAAAPGAGAAHPPGDRDEENGEQA